MNDEQGDELEHDPEWRGPLEGRSCTDIFCLIIFLVFLVSWTGVGFYAYANGNMRRLMMPTDSAGRKCGVDPQVADKPYVVFFDLGKCITSASLTCDTPQVCVSRCPTDNFFFARNAELLVSDVTLTDQGRLDALTAKMICKIDVNLDGKSLSQITKYVDSDECAGSYLASQSLAGRCVPTRIPDTWGKPLITETVLSEASQAIGYLENILKAVHDDFSKISFAIMVLLLMTAMLCLCYTILMHRIAMLTVFSSLLDRCTRICRQGYDATIVNLISFALQDFVAKWLQEGYVLALKHIQEAGGAVIGISVTLVIPVCTWIVKLVVVSFAVGTALYVGSMETPNYKILGTVKGYKCPEDLGYVDGSACLPEVFYSSCSTEDDAICTSTSSYLVTTDKPWFTNYMHVANVVGLFWLMSFVSSLESMILAGTFVTSLGTLKKWDAPFFALSASIRRTFRYHLGTLAFGSLLMTICRLIGEGLEYIDVEWRYHYYKITNVLIILERTFNFLNTYPCIVCAVDGKRYCSSMKDAFPFIKRNILHIFLLNIITNFLLFLGEIPVTSLVVVGTWWFLATNRIGYSYYILATLVGIGPYMVASISTGVYATAVDTLFICYLVHRERNDGSE